MTTTSSPLKHTTTFRWLGLLLVTLTVISLYRGWLLASSGLDLYLDEAQYWYWSQHLDWGYYSKPPMIAWLIALSTGICGNDSEYCIRLSSLLLYPTTALGVFFLTKRLLQHSAYAEQASRLSFWAAIVFFTLPAVSLSSLLISTDVALFFFWTWALVAFVGAIQTNRWQDWLMLAIMGGLGLLSKYTMGIFALSVFFFLIFEKNFRHHLVNPRLWLATLIAALIFLPNIGWNAANDFPTFQHTADIAKAADENTLQYSELGEFLFGQLGVFGIVFFPVLLYLWIRRKTWRDHWQMRLLSTFTLMFLLIIIAQSLFGRANANWAAPSYVAASVLVVVWLMGSQKPLLNRLLITGLLFNALLAVFIYHYPSLMKGANVELNQNNDLYKRLKGWRTLGEQVYTIRQRYPNTTLLAQNRELIAELSYYAGRSDERPITVIAWNPDQQLRHHYDLATSINDKTGQHFLYIGDHDENVQSFVPYFNTVQAIAMLTAPVNATYQRQYSVWLMQGFKGYMPPSTPPTIPSATP
ncbi:MAG: ArnT family glycosyltransferase [bacterium]